MTIPIDDVILRFFTVSRWFEEMNVFSCKKTIVHSLALLVLTLEDISYLRAAVYPQLFYIQTKMHKSVCYELGNAVTVFRIILQKL